MCLVYCTCTCVLIWQLLSGCWLLLNASGFDLSFSSRIPVLQSILCRVEEIKQEKTCLLQRVRLADSPWGAQLHCRCSHTASSGAGTSLAVLRSLEQVAAQLLTEVDFPCFCSAIPSLQSLLGIVMCFEC